MNNVKVDIQVSSKDARATLNAGTQVARVCAYVHLCMQWTEESRTSEKAYCLLRSIREFVVVLSTIL